VAKGRVTDQLLDTLKRVSSPELDFLNDWIPSVVQLVAMDFNEVAFPFRPRSRKVVDFLKQRIFRSERWLRFVTDLWCANEYTIGMMGTEVCRTKLGRSSKGRTYEWQA
jgi:hypothetical protein